MTTKYGHLSKIFVVVGQEVKRGQVIGAVGMTGKTTGPHLHYEVIVADTPVNPRSTCATNRRRQIVIHQ